MPSLFCGVRSCRQVERGKAREGMPVFGTRLQTGRGGRKQAVRENRRRQHGRADPRMDDECVDRKAHPGAATPAPLVTVSSLAPGWRRIDRWPIEVQRWAGLVGPALNQPTRARDPMTRFSKWVHRGRCSLASKPGPGHPGAAEDSPSRFG
jgi:hypothetical protein